jgi:hypothetical protein
VGQPPGTSSAPGAVKLLVNSMAGERPAAVLETHLLG